MNANSDHGWASPQTVDWCISSSPVDYPRAIEFMERRAVAIASGQAAELIWLLEHPPLYTSGTSARPEDLLDATRLPVFTTGRGGQFTYHGPGQRIVYVMLDLNGRKRDVRAFVAALESWIITVLAHFDVVGEVRPGRVGVWVQRADILPGREDKIAAIGIRLRRWVSLHGFSLNVAPSLEHFAGIVPCGITGHGVTSIEQLLGQAPDMTSVDREIERAFISAFGPTRWIDESEIERG